MNKTKPTLAQQTYEKVCAIETILNSLLADSSPPVSERPLYLATAGPEMSLSVIRLEDASDYLPCFDEADLLYGIPGLPILMSYCPEQVMDIGEESYLVGPMVFFRIDRRGILSRRPHGLFPHRPGRLHRLPSGGGLVSAGRVPGGAQRHPDAGW